MGTKEIYVDDQYVHDEYGEIVRKKKNVPVLACLVCLMKRVTVEDIQSTHLAEALRTPGEVVIDERLKREIFSHYLMDYVLPELGMEYPEVQQILVPQREGGANIVERTFYNSDMPMEDFDRMLWWAGCSTVGALKNDIPKERREKIRDRFEAIALSPNIGLGKR